MVGVHCNVCLSFVSTRVRTRERKIIVEERKRVTVNGRIRGGSCWELYILLSLLLV